MTKLMQDKVKIEIPKVLERLGRGNLGVTHSTLLTELKGELGKVFTQAKRMEEVEKGLQHYIDKRYTKRIKNVYINVGDDGKVLFYYGEQYDSLVKDFTARFEKLHNGSM